MSTNERRKPYPFHEIEPHWQKEWARLRTFRVANPGEPGFDASKPKYYVLDMFPYPSGAGLHVGHPEGYTATDILGRFKKMSGFNVLHPMGWDAFGLPAEQHAIKTGEHPSIQTKQNVDNFRRQLQSLGFGYDWEREVNTTDPNYYRWTQWIFLQLYGSWFNPSTQRAEPISTYPGEDKDSVRLAYVSEAPVNWCPFLGTVLANEEVIDGKSEVGGHPVERRPMRQWMLRITAYAQRLIDELDGLDWPEGIKLLQKNWIGRSEGAEVQFKVAGSGQPITVFTTRPDTLFGATYMVLAPEHRLVDEIVTEEQLAAVEEYREKTSRKSDLERTELAKEKTGVWTGAFAINPVNEQKIPIWIADYVLQGYGTGAIMAVPAHDERDWEFARKYALPIREVVSATPSLGLGGGGVCEAEPLEVFTDEGFAIHSGPLDGLPTLQAKIEMTILLEKQGLGKKTINYKLRDWLFSRQRYWGEPFPIVWKDGRHHAISESELPLNPPPLDDFKPTGTGEPPLAKAKDWVRYRPIHHERGTEQVSTAFPLPSLSEIEGVEQDGPEILRETNTMPQWAGSCWYYLRYCDAGNNERFVGTDAEKYWMGGGKPGGVDLYVGGTEHAVLHLLYARFWHKVLFDLGHVSTPEPFQRLVNQGLILGEPEYYAFVPATGSRDGIVTVETIDYIADVAQTSPLSSAEVEIKEELPYMLKGVHKSTGNEVFGLRLQNAEQQIEKRDNFFYLKGREIRVEVRVAKMSKSRKNVINPDEIVRDYGADSLRLYEMFMGPLEATKPWSMTGVEGVTRFLARVWRLVMEETQDGTWQLNPAVQDVPMDKSVAKVVHATIKKVGEDIETLSFNTAISQMMVCTNALIPLTARPIEAIRLLLTVLNPFAPHLSEELWSRLGGTGLLADRSWPAYDPALLVEDEIELPIQINGKVRDKMVVKKEATREEIEAQARASSKIAEWTAGKEIKKVVVVPGRLVNIVVA